jgi:type IV pilus assembly protein PilM
MDLLPKTLGTRPRLAVEIRPEGVVAARTDDVSATLTAVSWSEFPDGAVVPGLKPGNLAARAEAIAAVKRALEAVALKERQTTLVLPDAAVRVLLLDFDQLPAKAEEAMPVVRFRLKKLLPFDADDAIVSYQIMSTSRGLVRVLAVAAPREVLAEYESVVREAGFEPGAVLPSTLAACAGLTEMEAAQLLVNAGETGVTTAIVQGGVLLLHRTVDLAAHALEETLEAVAAEQAARESAQADLPASAFAVPAELLAHPEDASVSPGVIPVLPLVDPHDSAAEWTMQQPVNGYGVIDDERLARGEADRGTPRPVQPASHEQKISIAAREVTQAVSVAAAYFEDTLQSAPGLVLSAGTLGAEVLSSLLRKAGLSVDEMRVREMIEPAMLTGGAVTTRIPAGWLAGVRGALRS